MKLKRILKYPKFVIAVCLIITFGLCYFIKDLDIDNSTRLFFPQNDASYERLLETEDVYGSMAVVGVSLTSTKGSIITSENVDVVKNITDRIMAMSDVEDMDSLTHIDYVCETDGAISASQLVPDTYTGTDEDVKQLKDRLAEWNDMYDRVIVNDDYTATQMQISISTLSQEEADELGIVDSKRKDEAINEIKKIIEEEIAGKHLVYRIYGDDIITQNSRSFMISDLVVLIPVVVIVVLLSLFFSFKTVDGTLLPLLTVLMSTAQTCGLMSLFGFKFTIVSSIIPVALIAVGSAYGIHVLTHYYIAMEQSGEEFTKEKYQEAIFDGLEDVKLAVFLSGITTVIGFISLITSPLVPLHSFAIFTAIGVAISLVLALIFIPALLLVKSPAGVKREEKRKEKIEKRIREKLKAIGPNSSDTLYDIYRFFCGTKPRMIVFSIILIVISVVGLRLLNVETSLTGYFPENCQMNQDIDYVDDEFAGTYTLDFLVRGQQKSDICNPEILKAVDDMENHLRKSYPDIGKVVSFTTMLKRINQVWNTPSYDNLAASEEVSDDVLPDDFDDWGDDFGSDWGSEDETVEAEATENWVDPNITYLENLNQQVSVSEILGILHNAYVEAGGVNASVVDVVEYIEKDFNYNGMAYYEVPYDASKYPVANREALKGVVENYLTLLSGSLDNFLDDEMNPMEMKVQCQLRTHSTKMTQKIIDDAKAFAKENFPEGYTIEATGTAEMERRMTEMIVESQVKSLILSLVCVFIIITISFKSVLAGFIGAIPLALTIFLNYMVMGFAGINLDLVTSIIASVAVGVGIDYTIHFLTTYKEERAKSDDLVAVTKMTFRKSGNGIITNAIAVGFGFLVLCLSKFVVLRFIGLLVAIVMFTSSALAMTIIPGLLNLIKPKFVQPRKK